MTDAEKIKILQDQLTFYKSIVKAPVNQVVHKLAEDYRALTIKYAEKVFELTALKLDNAKLRDQLKRAGG